MPSTSFQTWTSFAASAEANKLAVKSVPPLPRVVIWPNSSFAINPVTTGVRPSSIRTSRFFLTSIRESSSTFASPNSESVLRPRSKASIAFALKKLLVKYWAIILTASLSPNETNKSLVFSWFY
jgi:hypothetical protein